MERSEVLSHRVSAKTGFLTEEASLDYGNVSALYCDDVVNYINTIRGIAENLPELIKNKQVVGAVNNLFAPEVSLFNDINWPLANNLMLWLTMITHAYMLEQLGYKTVEELKADDSPKYLCAQLALPLYRLHLITGVEPSASYCFYGLWNYRRVDSSKPITVDNVRMKYSYTDSEDEHWFVGTHNDVEVTFAPAIEPLLEACLLSQYDKVSTEVLSGVLAEAIVPNILVVQSLKRVREKCSAEFYFKWVRMFFSFPRNVTFEGVSEWKNMDILGETGGQSPFQHFRLAILGIKHHDPYFPRMRKHMQKNFREFLEVADQSKVREVVLARKDKTLDNVYNTLVQTVIDWRNAHGDLAREYVADLGDPDGTSKAPVTWLKHLKDETEKYLIQR